MLSDQDKYMKQGNNHHQKWQSITTLKKREGERGIHTYIGHAENVEYTKTKLIGYNRKH